MSIQTVILSAVFKKKVSSMVRSACRVFTVRQSVVSFVVRWQAELERAWPSSSIAEGPRFLRSLGIRFAGSGIVRSGTTRFECDRRDVLRLRQLILASYVENSRSLDNDPDAARHQ
jgi:hypothetical protein